MTVKDVLDEIRALPNYVTNSVVVKGSDDSGCTYVYLINDGGVGKRKEIFIATDSSEAQGEGRVVITSIEVVPAE
jgi:hypothetical protein